MNTAFGSFRKIGLLGAGYICESHAKALGRMPGVEILAVCDRSMTRAEAAARQFGIPKACASLEELLDTPVEVVHVLLPPDLHFEAARRVLESGRHAFLEKPMALSSADCLALCELAERKGLRLAVNHNFLFLPAYEQLRADLATGSLGRIERIEINWMFPLGLIQTGPFDNWILRSPGNMVLELGPHLAAFAVDLAGPVEEMQVRVSRPIALPGGAIAFRRWTVRCEHGDTEIHINLSVSAGQGDRSVTVYGQAATARMDYARNLYFREESSGRAAILDSLSHSLRLASHGLIAGTGNFLKAAANTFRKAPAANPYGESIERSIRAFYNEGAATADRRMARQFGADVIRVCEEIVYRANVPGRNTAGKGAAVAPPLKRPSVLVIGGSGFLGRYLVDALAARGLGVRVATRSADSARIVLAGLPMELVQGSLSNPRFLDEALEGIDVVYHLAKADGRKWEDYYTQDVLVTKNIAERALAAKVRRLIYTGTIDSYYSADPHAVITSDTPLDPGIGTRNLYARSKAACEALLMEMHRSAGLPVVIFRPGIVIGRGCPPAHWGIGMFTSETLVRYWGDGLNKLPLVLVRDVADALARGLDWPGIEGQSFLVTDDPLICGRDYVEAVESAMGTRVRAVPTPAWQFFAGDLVKEAAKFAIRHPNRKVPSYRDWASRSHRARYDSSKTREVLGWRPAGTREALIEQGVLAAVRDFAR